jgi:ceramide glucosyltransferase
LIWILLYFLAHLALMVYLDAGARGALAHSEGLPAGDSRVPVTVIVPVSGADRFTQRNFRSWLLQDYDGEVQTVFSLQREDDPALPLLESLASEHPLETMVNPVKDGFSGKTSNLHHALRASRHDVLIFSDADIWAPPDTIRKIVRLLEEGRDLVSCLPKHLDTENLWGHLYSLLWNVILLMLWAPQRLAGRDLGIAGAVVGLRKGTLDRLGGMDAFKDYLAEDFAIGRAAQQEGLGIALGPVVTSSVGRLRFRQLYDKWIRAHLVSIHMAPSRLVGSALLHLFFAAYLPLLGMGLWTANLPLVAACLTFMAVKGWFGGRLTRYASGRFRFPTPYPLGDLLQPVTFLIAALRPRVSWGGLSFDVSAGGKLTRRG